MRIALTQAAGLLLAGLSAATGLAADVKPAAAPAGPEVHKMIILNGPNYSAHYFSVGLSTSDQASLGDLERAENDAAYAGDLQNLRRLYIADEAALEPQRAAMQRALYGKSITRSSEDYLTNMAYGPGYYSYPYAYAGGFNGYAGATSSYFGGSSSTWNYSLANGIGDEGVLKTSLAPALVSQATTDFLNSAGRAYTTALGRVGESESLRTAMNINNHGVVSAAAEAPRRVTLTFKDGKDVEGTISREDNDWITVDNGTDEVSVRKGDVARIVRHKGK